MESCWPLDSKQNQPTVLCYPSLVLSKQGNKIFGAWQTVKNTTTGLYYDTESQNGRGWKAPLKIIWSYPLVQAGTLKAGCQGPCPTFNNLKVSWPWNRKLKKTSCLGQKIMTENVTDAGQDLLWSDRYFSVVSRKTTWCTWEPSVKDDPRQLFLEVNLLLLSLVASLNPPDPKCFLPAM